MFVRRCRVVLLLLLVAVDVQGPQVGRRTCTQTGSVITTFTKRKHGVGTASDSQSLREVVERMVKTMQEI